MLLGDLHRSNDGFGLFSEHFLLLRIQSPEMLEAQALVLNQLLGQCLTLKMI